MSTSRDQIMQRVRDALSPLPTRAPLPAWDRDLVHMHDTVTPTELWPLFAERLTSVNGEPCEDLTALVAILRENQWTHGYCDPALWPEVAVAFTDDYTVGITAATGAIAETGTLILGNLTTSSRLAALAPWAHIAVVRSDQQYPDIPAAITALPDEPNLIWVTGPPKTADVEGILIEGVHGPGRQFALRLDRRT
ncbi:MAG: LUD domain-containing protein [Candidatus Synoicihabitans palmerolidicus]|nr:LUD domain-containing protein [Candidatus Synoicihabitans palmerolidicus]